MGMIDVQAMVWAFVAAWTPINPHLSLVKPNLKLCSKRIMVPIIEVVVLAAVTQYACFVLLKSTDWYHQGQDGATASLQVRTWLWLSILKPAHVLAADVAADHHLSLRFQQVTYWRLASLTPDASCSCMYSHFCLLLMMMSQASGTCALCVQCNPHLHSLTHLQTLAHTLSPSSISINQCCTML